MNSKTKLYESKRHKTLQGTVQSTARILCSNATQTELARQTLFLIYNSKSKRVVQNLEYKNDFQFLISVRID